MSKIGKVLFLVNYDTVIYNFRLELVERLIKEGISVVIATPFGERTKELEQIGAKVLDTYVERHGTNPVKDLKLILNYSSIIKKEEPDVVLTYTIKPNIYGGIAATINNVRYMSNITGLGTAVEKKGILQKITIGLYRIGLKNVSCLFFQNAENQQFFKNKIMDVKKEVLLPGSGVNLKRFDMLEYPKTTTIEFIFVSRIMKEKGIEQYLDMAEYIHKKYPDTKFHICGFFEDKTYEARIERMQSEGVVEYHGMVKNIKDFYKDIHCTIHPSFYPEGMSNVCLESAASGRPVITTDRSGCRETVDDGKTGYIVKQKDTQDLIDKVEKFITLSYEEKKQMGLNARDKMEKEFSREIVVEEYMREIVAGEK